MACRGSNSTYEVSSTSRYGLKVLAVQGLGLVFQVFFFLLRAGVCLSDQFRLQRLLFLKRIVAQLGVQGYVLGGLWRKVR